MRHRNFLSVIMLLAGWLAALPAAAAPLANQLRGQASPYLALHADDPVAWQEWNAATVGRARQEGKLLFLSIGYFSCHWCHVMQRESYRDAEIAAFLNEHFIPVKIDRELDPALDARLIDFSMKTRGRSGWPLNVFVTPDGHPLYATLYHPPQEFFAVLKQVDGLWRTDRARLTDLARVEARPASGPGRPQLERAQVTELVNQAVAESLKHADWMLGGFGDQNKFPQVPQLSFLLAQLERGENAELQEFLRLTLDAMAGNGLMDQLGGGFFRYATDPSWKTPHFEKMLYDNAQLARLYRRAARVLGRDDYRQIGRRTLDFMLAELRAPEGAMIAALSALDDQGVEGGYYLWNAEQLQALLTPEEAAAWRLHAGLGAAPAFDRGWLPLRGLAADETGKRLKRTPAAVAALTASAEDKLRRARARRGLPRDTKLLAAWNGLALTALAEAGGADGRYREAARRLRDYLATVLWDGQALARSRVAGQASGRAALEDYAYVASGLTRWAMLTGDRQDYRLARAVAREGWRRFYGVNGWRLEENTLLVAEPGQDVIADGPMPSPSAALIDASLQIAGQLDDPELRRQALAALSSGADVIADNPFWHVTSIEVLQRAAASEKSSRP